MDEESSFNADRDGQQGDEAAGPFTPGWQAGSPDWLDTPYQPTPAEPLPSKKRRRARVSLTIGALVVVAVIGLVASQGSSSGPKSVEATVSASVDSAFASKTAVINLTMDIHSPSVSVTANGPGVIDFANGSLSATLEMHLESQQVAVTVMYMGGMVYESIPGLQELEPGKSWIDLDFKGASITGTGAVAGGGNPTAMLALLQQRGAVVVPLGNATVDGVATKSYEVTISHAMFNQELQSAQLPSWLRAAAVNVNFSDSTETVYIDGSNRLRRCVIQTDITTNGQTVSVHETLDLSDYGAAATISAPPANETVGFQQFLKDAEAAGGSQS